MCVYEGENEVYTIDAPWLVRVCVCMRDKKGEGMRCTRLMHHDSCVRERERESVCVCMNKRMGSTQFMYHNSQECVCVRERVRERENEVYAIDAPRLVCVRERERERVCVCV